MAVRPWNIISLCAGTGGLGLGVQLAERNAVCVAHVEREAPAAATLVARMAQGLLAPAPVWSDLGTFDARPWRGVVDCVISGDPCQPNSVAGKGLGAADDRFLIDQVVRIVRECRPRRVFRENVFGNADGQLAVFVPALEAMGYRVAAGIFSAEEVGASHRRERLFIMADAPGELCGETRRLRRDGPTQWAAGSGAAVDDACSIRLRAHDEMRARWDAAFDAGNDLAQPDNAHVQGGGQRSDPLGRQEPLGHVGLGGGSVVPIHCPGPNDSRWSDILAQRPDLAPAVKREVRGMADGNAARVDQLRAIGNGVHPLAVGYAWCALDALLAESAGDVAVRAAA